MISRGCCVSFFGAEALARRVPVGSLCGMTSSAIRPSLAHPISVALSLGVDAHVMAAMPVEAAAMLGTLLGAT
jgi:hypothetical protein